MLIIINLLIYNSLTVGRVIAVYLQFTQIIPAIGLFS